MSVEGGEAYWSGVAIDRFNFLGHTFRLPLQAASASPITIWVIDQDGKELGDGELIAQFHLDMDDLTQLVETGSVRVLSAPGLGLTKLAISAAIAKPKSRRIVAKMNASEGIELTPEVIFAGDTLEIRASGEYLDDASHLRLGPAGTDKAVERLPSFSGAHFGAALALISDDVGGIHGIEVRDCTRVVAARTGTLAVGVNDPSATGDTGHFSFSISVSPATLGSWRAPGLAMPCLPEALTNFGTRSNTSVFERCANWYNLTSFDIDVAVDAAGQPARTAIRGGLSSVAIRCISLAVNSTRFPSKRKGYRVRRTYKFAPHPG